MSDASDLLLQLRDVHEPLPPEASSPVLLLVIIMACLLAAVYLLIWQRRRRRAGLDAAIAQIDTARGEQPAAAMLRLARLLRQLAHTKTRDSINQLEGMAWQEELDRLFTTSFFTSGNGKVFGNSLYQSPPPQDEDIAQQCNELQQLLKSRWPL